METCRSRNQLKQHAVARTRELIDTRTRWKVRNDVKRVANKNNKLVTEENKGPK